MQPLPSHVKAAADALVAVAPPLSLGQKRLIQSVFAPLIAEQAAAREAQAA